MGPGLASCLGFLGEGSCSEVLESELESQKDEVELFLRLSVGFKDDLASGDRNVSSRSLKRTCLSWASKAGLDKDVRALLKRHTSAQWTWACRLFRSWVWFVRKGIFCLDAEKHRRWAWSQRCEPVPEPDPHFWKQARDVNPKR